MKHKATKPITTLEALKGLRKAVNGISGYWDESVANWMQAADEAIKAHKPPLVLVTVSGGVADVQLEQPGSALVALYDFDGNDCGSEDDEPVTLPIVASGLKGLDLPDWAAIRADARFHA